MKRLLVTLLLIPSLAFGTFTEFYCQSGGSNLNAGSTNNNTALYTSTNGGWNSGTSVFTPTDGTNPVSAGVAVGMFASVYTDGASVGVYVGRVSAVTNSANGTITVPSPGFGTAPSTNASARTIKVGGAWQGPNGASGFPFTSANYGNNKDSTSHQVRTNLKNDQTYLPTSSFAFVSSGSPHVVQGYSSSVGDTGLATFDGSTSTGAIITDLGISGTDVSNLKFTTSISSGSTDLVTSSKVNHYTRCVFTGSRNNGLNVQGSGSVVTECEFYGNNTANTASKAGLFLLGNTLVKRSFIHDNTGSNTIGCLVTGNGNIIDHSVIATNGKYGVSITSSLTGVVNTVSNCDIYNNGSDGINIATALTSEVWIENTNFVKSTGAGINNVSVVNFGYVYNCAYGAGTQANGSADTLNNLTQPSFVTYASNTTPWIDPANGNFAITPASAAVAAGRGAFTTTASSYGPTVGYPDIGAADAATPTPTPSATATATATATPTATACAGGISRANVANPQ
jgi:hypothetical protein